MDFFKNYYSNTLAGSGNQSYFNSDPNKIRHSRIFFPIFKGGKYGYSLLFGNTVDSTYSDGSFSKKNTVCGKWVIHSLCAGITKNCTPEKFVEIRDMQTVTFGGKEIYTVNSAGFFNTDSFEVNAEKDDFLCVDMTFSGDMLPCHPESMIPSFILNGEEWIPSTDMPFPLMTGCDRPIKKKIAFFGDSITQGIGVGKGNYNFWNAVLSEKLGDGYGYWNLGLGYGRADDAASDGIWLQKAKHSDFVFLCFGVNDIYQGFTAKQIKDNLLKTVSMLHKAGCKVMVQTVPPGDYSGEWLEIWNEVNEFILDSKILCADKIFNCVPFLYKSAAEPYLTASGNVHPDEEYSLRWANAIYPAALDFLKNI